MSDEEGKLKMHISFGGVVSIEDNKFSYKDGEIANDMLIDPDFLTFSIFEDFSSNGQTASGKSNVLKVWYRLPNEDVSSARCIYIDKDNEILKMWSEAKEFREVYIYVEHSDIEFGENFVNERYWDEGDKADDEKYSDEEDREEEESDQESSEEEGLENIEQPDAPSEDDNHILGEGAHDSRFANFLAQAEKEAPRYGLNGLDEEVGYNSDIEGEIQLPPNVYPDSAEDTDEEWANWEKDDTVRYERGRTKADYDKPPYLWLMQTFHNGNEFKDQLLRYVLKTQFDVKLNKWHPQKHAAICTHENCKWRIYCSVEKPIRKWMVKVYVDEHNHLPTGRVRMLKQGTIGRLFKEEARRRPEIRSSEIKDELMDRYNISVSIFKCQKARRIALDLVLDTQKQQFAKLWDYEKELHRSNKDITTEIVTVEENGIQVFKSFYICFEPLRRTWKKCCRPLIGLDGAFLKWALKGEILAAVGRDAENRIYPIAWAIVKGENKESWEWFIKKLKDDLTLGLGDGITFISDRQKGLKVALATVLPNAEHRNCAKHVYGNWKKKYGDSDYKPFFWNVAYSKTLGEYDSNMTDLLNFDKEAHDDLLAAEPKTWCLAFFTSNARSANVCNSLSESFNRTIKGARELPLINMLETIRRQAMARVTRRLKRAKKCILPFPKKIGDLLEQNRLDSKHCSVLISSDNLFEVVLYGCGYEVSLRKRHCACNEWDLTGIPCPHAICVINDNHQQPEHHVDKCYKTTVWIENYSDNIAPANGELFWEKTGKDPIGVPGFRKLPGRPKKNRIKPAHESPSKPNRVTRGGRTITCSNCKKDGHNRSTCKNSTFVEGPKRKRGRPRKQPENGAKNPCPPKRARATQSQPSISAPSVNPPISSTASPSSTAPSGARRGRPPRKQSRKKVNVPRGQGVYMCPFTDRVFQCWGSTSREVGGGSSQPQNNKK